MINETTILENEQGRLYLFNLIKYTMKILEWSTSDVKNEMSF